MNGTRAALTAHVQTWRPYTLWYVGLLGLGGAAQTAGVDPSGAVEAWLAPTVGWIGGHYLCDYFDRRLDAVSKPHRPIPSGRLAPGAAVAAGIACLTTVVLMAAFSGWLTLVVGLAAVVAIVAYSRALKARGIAGNLVRGALGALVLLFGALSTGHTGSVALVLLSVAVWLHDACSNLVGTLRDVTGDEAGGYRTLPVTHGLPVAIATTAALYAATLVAFAAAGLLYAGAHRLAFLVLLAVVAVLGTVALGPLMRRPREVTPRTALHAHEVLVSERLVLAAAAICLGFGPLLATGLLVPAAVLTVWTQARMRAGYEFGPDGDHRDRQLQAQPRM
jgi:geranylgeranylglycerol-phosphate geranylgeranyltransferase